MKVDTLDLKVARIHRMPSEGAIRAFVDLTVNNSILLKGFRVVNGERGLFVTMPQDKGKNNRWYNTVDCLSSDVRSLISQFILTAFKEETENN